MNESFNVHKKAKAETSLHEVDAGEKAPFSAAMREILKSIDFKELQNVFEEIGHRYAGDEYRGHFVTAEHMYALLPESPFEGGYEYNSGGLKDEGKSSRASEVLATICHEEGHAAVAEPH